MLVLFVLSIVAVTLVHAGGPSYPKACPKLGEDDLIPCIQRILDGNNDSTITTDELEDFMDMQPPIMGKKRNEPRGSPIVNVPFTCLPDGWKASFLNETIIMTLCDADSSGNLTIADWHDGNSCLKSAARRMSLCLMCEYCLGLLNARHL